MIRGPKPLVVVVLALVAMSAMAAPQDEAKGERPRGPVSVSESVVPTITPAARDQPDWTPSAAPTAR